MTKSPSEVGRKTKIHQGKTPQNKPVIHYYRDDLPDNFPWSPSWAIDTETMGLQHHRDRLCLVQLSNGDGHCHLVHIGHPSVAAPNLKSLLEDKNSEKIFHYGRFDITALYAHLGALCEGPIFCTKIASKLVRTYTDFHGLRTLCRELLCSDISKGEQTSDWGAPELTTSQKQYAAYDVFYLHGLRDKLIPLLVRENRYDLFQSICSFLPTRSRLDALGFLDDVFLH